MTIGMLLAVGACSPNAAGDPAPVAQDLARHQNAVHPVSGLPVIPLTVSTPHGEYEFTVEVAASADEQARGLMFRTALGGDEGMIFPRRPADLASFWMKDTPLPLDIIFIGTDGRILNIAAQAVPNSMTHVSAVDYAAAVLEIPGGRAAELGIGHGDRVDFAGAPWAGR
ncbi:MAG: DUF192 domain-containing protein [Sphingomonadales bacterium]|nr:DUF192 domain-containing protein [Sphingomonadales bacterium]MBD3772009.1 DUF192 domain-containing protein [Paracoccaceae bacterium]